MGILGERLRAERTKFDLKQSELAAKAGITTKSQGAYERGERSPTAEYLSALAGIGIDVTYVLTGERVSDMLGLTLEEAALIDNYRNMGDEQKESITKVSSALVMVGTSSGKKETG